MVRRLFTSTLAFALCGLAFAHVPPANPPVDKGRLPAEEPETFVSLFVTKATASKHDGKYVLFTCDASMFNATGKELAVYSSFYSAFDGLELVVTSTDGKILAQQAYISHQSPFTPSPGREFTLKRGTTTKALVFPAYGFPADVKQVKVRLVGKLPGSGYDRILSTETVEVKIPE